MLERVRRLVAHSLIGAIALSLVASALPSASVPLSPTMAAASGETVSSPRYIAVAVMPNGQVGMIFDNSGSETRFKRYIDEQATDPSIQLSTAAPAYPQIATFQGELVAGYTDTRAPNAGRFILRISTDNGATWAPSSIRLVPRPSTRVWDLRPCSQPPATDRPCTSSPPSARSFRPSARQQISRW